LTNRTVRPVADRTSTTTRRKRNAERSIGITGTQATASTRLAAEAAQSDKRSLLDLMSFDATDQIELIDKPLPQGHRH
jgi:hypothetical protein